MKLNHDWIINAELWSQTEMENEEIISISLSHPDRIEVWLIPSGLIKYPQQPELKFEFFIFYFGEFKLEQRNKKN